MNGNAHVDEHLRFALDTILGKPEKVVPMSMPDSCCERHERTIADLEAKVKHLEKMYLTHMRIPMVEYNANRGNDPQLDDWKPYSAQTREQAVKRLCEDHSERLEELCAEIDEANARDGW